MKSALGLIETKGLVAAVAAADKALKSAKVLLEGKEITEPGYVTIRFTGDLSEVQIAVSAGAEAARDAGELVSSLVIAEPDSRLNLLLGNSSPYKVIEAVPEINRSFEHSVPVKPVQVHKKKDILSAPNSSEPLNGESSLPPPLKDPVVPNQPEILPEEKTGEPAGLKSVIKKRQAGEDKVKEDVPAEIKKNLPHRDKHTLDTISRLRMEALGEKYKNDINSDTLTVKENGAQDLNELNVHQLRKLARNTPDFPIFGRKISKANRDELLKLFNGLGN